MIRRSRKRSVRSLKIIFLFFLILFLLIFFLIIGSGFFHIKHIEIQGDKLNCATSDQLKDASGLIGQNFFLLNNKKVQADLKTKFICIKKILFNRFLPDIIRLEIIPRKPVVILASLSSKQASTSSLIENIATPEAEAVQDSYMIDDEGVIFAKSTDEINISRIYIYNPDIAVGQKLENSFLSSSLKILEKIKTFGVTSEKSWITEEFLIINPETSDPKIIFRLDDEIDIQLASLQLILTEAKIDLMELKSIDLRFDKPIVKFAPKKT